MYYGENARSSTTSILFIVLSFIIFHWRRRLSKVLAARKKNLSNARARMLAKTIYTYTPSVIRKALCLVKIK